MLRRRTRGFTLVELITVIVILGALGAVWLAWLLGSIGRPTGWTRRVGVPFQVAAGLVLLAFAIVRNLPGLDGLRG